MIRKVNDNRSIVLVADKKLINMRHHMQTCGIIVFSDIFKTTVLRVLRSVKHLDFIYSIAGVVLPAIKSQFSACIFLNLVLI